MGTAFVRARDMVGWSRCVWSGGPAGGITLEAASFRRIPPSRGRSPYGCLLELHTLVTPDHFGIETPTYKLVLRFADGALPLRHPQRVPHAHCNCNKHCDRAVGCTWSHTVPAAESRAGVNGPRATSSGPPALGRMGCIRCHVACRVLGAHAACLAGASHAVVAMHPCMLAVSAVCFTHAGRDCVLRTRLPYAPPARPTPCALCAHRLRSRAGGRGATGAPICGVRTGVCVCTHAHPWRGHARPSVALARVCACGARVRACARARVCVCVCARWLRVRLRGELRRIFTPLAVCSDLV
jgi:hypothetical protein